jgi:predicted HicB family RNase H-like nuclease
MGRQASTASGKVTIVLDERLKMRAAIEALRRKTTLTRLIEDALREYLKHGKDSE